jgi:hypothetical protein
LKLIWIGVNCAVARSGNSLVLEAAAGSAERKTDTA